MTFASPQLKPRSNSPLIQAKLTIGQPGDKYEQEADAMADQVMHMPQSAAPIQRQCEDCEEESLQMKPLVPTITSIVQMEPLEEEEDMVQAKSEGGSMNAKADLSSQLSQSKGEGSGLSDATNHNMSNAFGTDFSEVRMHTDSNAIQMNRSLGARAFTHGSDVYFNKGEYSPNSGKGKHLLAHELTHVVQQSERRGAGKNDLINQNKKRKTTNTPQLKVNSTLQKEEGETNAEVRSCGPDVTDWFVNIMNSAKANRSVLEIKSKLTAARRIGARIGYSSMDVFEGGLVRKVLNAERSAGSPTRTTDASSQIRSADPSNQFGRALIAATAPIPFVGARHQSMFLALRAAALTWKSLVQTGAIYDFKNTALSRSSLASMACPSPCTGDPTLSMFGTCFENDLPGNIFYAYISKFVGYSRNAVHLGSQFAELLPTSSSGWDTPQDTAALNLGYSLSLGPITRAYLGAALRLAGSSVTIRNCSLCPVTFQPAS